MEKLFERPFMKSSKIRSTFQSYFQQRDHMLLPSSPLVPKDDPTLLFINAGMNQFKNVFLGLEPAPHPRAVTIQKCVRAGGKHNDLENVGFTARHHTFFEMLGNFSFGDYFKKDAIRMSWEFLTKTLGLPADRLYVTVFHTDDEAAEIWHKQEGVPKERIFRLGEEDNFWRMGDTGPCGPCSEIFWDHGPGADADPNKPTRMGEDGDRFVEIWNLVFMQYFENPKGTLTPLPRPSVDTGSGLERLAAVLQGTPNNYDTDLFLPLYRPAEELAGIRYIPSQEERKLKDPVLRAQNTALRVVADHARAAAFLIADGVLPSNEGRGYVLRRIMRRAIRFARELTSDETLYPRVVEEVLAQMQGPYPELSQQKSVVARAVSEEVSRFLKTLDQGTEMLQKQLKTLSPGDTLPGEVVFKLYDTYGFPADLTRLVAQEKGVQVDEKEFEKRQEEAKELARASWKGGQGRESKEELIKWASEVVQKSPPEFQGYESLQAQGKVLSLFQSGAAVNALKAGEDGYALISPTPFYAEGGGQVGDQGELASSSGRVQVTDTQKIAGAPVLRVQVQEGILETQSSVDQRVDQRHRREAAIHHSAAHLLHSALREVLGTHIRQAGSLVEPDRLRFDFTHTEGLKRSQIDELEAKVNDQIAQALPVSAVQQDYDKAVEQGALTLAGESYEDKVRVVGMGGFSKELCGGTHVNNTSEVRLFKIVSESGVSSGVRRIEALAGQAALNYLNQIQKDYHQFKAEVGVQESWTQILAGPEGLKTWLKKNKEQIKTLEETLRKFQSSSFSLEDAVKSARPLSKGAAGKWVYVQMPTSDRDLLSQTADQIRDKLGQGVSVVTSSEGPKHALIVTVSKDLSGSIRAGDVIRRLSKSHGGKGGGRPDFAQGALENLEGIEKTLAEIL